MLLVISQPVSLPRHCDLSPNCWRQLTM